MTPALGSFGVVRTNGWAAPWIRLITHSEVNHAFVHVGHGRIVEANPSGAALGTVDEYPDAIWSTMTLTDDQRQDIVVAAIRIEEDDVPYSWVDVACVGLAQLFGWHVPEPVRKRLNRRTRLMCAQLCDAVYRDAGVELFHDGRISGDVTPGDLLTLIQHEKAAA